MTTLTIRPHSQYGMSFVEPWQIVRDGSEAWTSYATLKEAVAAAFPLFAWPGGYDIEYITDDCIELCGECARAAYLDNARRIPGKSTITGEEPYGAVVEEADRDIICEGCGRLILAQNLCPDHGYQPDAIMDRDEPFAYRCPICDRDDPAFVRHCDICGETLHPGNVSRDDDAVCQSCYDAL